MNLQFTSDCLAAFLTAGPLFALLADRLKEGTLPKLQRRENFAIVYSLLISGALSLYCFMALADAENETLPLAFGFMFRAAGLSASVPLFIACLRVSRAAIELGLWKRQEPQG